MATRLTPEQETEIKRRAQFANVPDDIRALLAEISALRERLDDTEVALDLERADNAFKTVLWETAIKDAAQLRKELEDAKAGLVWSNELPTEPGWYWYRLANGNSPEAVEVWLGDHDGELRVSRLGSSPYDDDEPLSSYGGNQWAGPIAPPEAKP